MLMTFIMIVASVASIFNVFTSIRDKNSSAIWGWVCSSLFALSLTIRHVGNLI